MIMINKAIASILPLMPERLIWQFSKSYIAGESTDAAISASKDLNAKGITVTIDILGEFIKTLDEAEKNRDEYLALIDTVQASNIDGNYSVKPTMFGLLIDKAACLGYIRPIVKKAADYGNFVRIDMEDSTCVDDEIEIFRTLKKEFPENVGLVLQAYLRRTHDDIKAMLDLNSDDIPVNYRLCKGIYVEPKEVAFQDYDEVNRHYLENLEFMFKNGIFAAIATHDVPLVQGAMALLKKYNVPKNRYEFQMLYGVTPELRKSIVDAGHSMRVYVPYGKQWFGYSTRRLKENPKMASYIIKALFNKG